MNEHNAEHTLDNKLTWIVLSDEEIIELNAYASYMFTWLSDYSTDDHNFNENDCT